MLGITALRASFNKMIDKIFMCTKTTFIEHTTDVIAGVAFCKCPFLCLTCFSFFLHLAVTPFQAFENVRTPLSLKEFRRCAIDVFLFESTAWAG